jgi:hypothetical protein
MVTTTMDGGGLTTLHLSAVFLTLCVHVNPYFFFACGAPATAKMRKGDRLSLGPGQARH